MILKRQEVDNIITATYDSSNVLASIYNKNTSDLDVVFKSGQKYRYAGVSASDYMRLEIAESQGQVFNSHIKKYPFQKLETVDPSMILNEAADLKAQEDAAMLEGLKKELLDKVELIKLIGGVITEWGKATEDTRKQFLKAAKEAADITNKLITKIENK